MGSANMHCLAISKTQGTQDQCSCFLPVGRGMVFRSNAVVRLAAGKARATLHCQRLGSSTEGGCRDLSGRGIISALGGSAWDHGQ